MTRWSLAAPLVVVMLVAGCGSGTHAPGTTTTTTTTASSPTNQSASSASLAPYLVRAGEETGFSPEGAKLVSTPAEWAKGGEGGTGAGEAAETRRLTEEGFRGVLREGTTSSNGGGASFVLELGTPSAAQREVVASLAEEHGSSQFKIATIPDSHGWEESGNGKVVANVLFSEGSCVLGVGDELPSGTDPKPAVTAGALKVYGRTAHSNGVCTRGAP